MRQWKVRDVMTTDVVTVHADTPYGDIVSALARHRISAVPVVDRFREVIGVVSEADLLHKVEFIGDTVQRVFEWGNRKTSRAKAEATTAVELMSSPAVTVKPGESVVVAAKRMEAAKVKRLPVVNDRGCVVGVVARSDLLKMYLRPDHDLRDDIVEKVLRQMLWIDPLTVRAEVRDGAVTLTGSLERKSTAELAVHVTKSVPGVIHVIDQISWEHDDTRVTAATGQ
jgi:CBS-domain-containing membrane protein